ncbi:MAG: type 3 dihydrofolate reductase [Gammaproteobacteria bacterium]|nr:type 3 dihydrofolate reductase [Gammaproteobacteria bacterium]MDH5734905.1 type 3 dihydrofolate reductase [Gammaproteobacteria bacterium]
MIISLVAAMDNNRLIGRKNGLPWHLPADFKHFKEVTMGKPVVMGRKTFESIGRPLPERKNIVISRGGFEAEGVIIVGSIDQALEAAGDAEEVMIIGGASFYQQMMTRADRMYLTHVDAECEGDAWFPEFNLADWDILSEQKHEADEKNNYSFLVRCYQRKNN